MTRYTFQESSELDVTADTFLSTFTMKEANSELMPLARMTVPDSWKNKPILEWPVKEHVFDSWILLFGILPVDRHSISFESIEQNVGFKEVSTTLMNRRWIHRRGVSESGTGCKVTDTVEFEPRLAFIGIVTKFLYRLTFSNRHRVLRKRYGGSS